MVGKELLKRFKPVLTYLTVILIASFFMGAVPYVLATSTGNANDGDTACLQGCCCFSYFAGIFAIIVGSILLSIIFTIVPIVIFILVVGIIIYIIVKLTKRKP